MKQALIVANLKRIRIIASLLCSHLPASRFLEYDDLCGEGFIGLAEAVRRFDPECGTTGAGYFAARIQGAMLDAIRKESGRQGSTTVARASLPLGKLDFPAEGLSPESQCLQGSREAALAAAVLRLPKQERAVMGLRLAGLRGCEMMPILDLSKGRISQLNTSAVRLLRKDRVLAAFA